MPKKHVVYSIREWTDEEPDTFRMSIQSGAGDDEKFVVMTGNATWLNLEQAKEVFVELGKYIEFIEKQDK
jgi:hypothetical protein